jgi:serine/threonine protein phosphatase PrpC
VWRWAGACAIGTSHVKSGLECQNRASCLTVETGSGQVIVAVVSDGAGSAQKAASGANIVCMELHRRIAAYLRSGGELQSIDKECVADWIDSVRDKIGLVANAAALRPRDYAATLVTLLADKDRAVVVHVGDGAATVRDRETKEMVDSLLAFPWRICLDDTLCNR